MVLSSSSFSKAIFTVPWPFFWEILTFMPKWLPIRLSSARVASSFVAPIPELEANSANKFFDGLSAGCCFALNHGGWQAEILRETGAGLQLDRDVTIAARQLQELADYPQRLAQAKIAARELAEERFSRDKLAAQLEQVLLRAVANHPS